MSTVIYILIGTKLARRSDLTAKKLTGKVAGDAARVDGLVKAVVQRFGCLDILALAASWSVIAKPDC
jgi:hypothetical protein